PPPGMAERHMAEFMGDDAAQFLRRHLARAEPVEKAAGEEDAAVRRRKAGHRRHLVDADRYARDAERAGEPFRDGTERGVARLRRVGVKFRRRPPGREAPEDDGIEKREEDRRQLQHGVNMGWTVSPEKAASAEGPQAAP